MNDRLLAVFAYVTDRLKEASTWRGIILAVTALTGYNLPPDKLAAVITIGVAAAGLVGMLFPDKLKGPPQ